MWELVCECKVLAHSRLMIEVFWEGPGNFCTNKFSKRFWCPLRTHEHAAAATAAKSLQSCPTLCDPIDSSPPGYPSLGFSRQEHWSGLPFPSAMHESEKWKWSRSVMSDSSRPHGLEPTMRSVHGIFQARVLELGAIAFSICYATIGQIPGKADWELDEGCLRRGKYLWA